MNRLTEVSQIETSDNITWSAHHTKKQRGPVFEVSITSLLPLFRDQVHSVATIRHVMNKIKDTVTYLNPIQYPDIAADRPFYVFTKQIVALTRKVWQRQVLLLCLEVSVLKWWHWSPLEPSFKIVEAIVEAGIHIGSSVNTHKQLAKTIKVFLRCLISDQKPFSLVIHNKLYNKNSYDYLEWQPSWKNGRHFEFYMGNRIFCVSSP